VLNTWQTVAAALGSAEQPVPGSRRFIIDFTGGDLAYYLNDPQLVEVVPPRAKARSRAPSLSRTRIPKGFARSSTCSSNLANLPICGLFCAPVRGRSRKPGRFRGVPIKAVNK